VRPQGSNGEFLSLQASDPSFFEKASQPLKCPVALPSGTAHVLASLNVGSIRLMTNNPRKIAGLEQLGIRVTGRIPLVIPAAHARTG
jgi:hypothetical protein